VMALGASHSPSVNLRIVSSVVARVTLISFSYWGPVALDFSFALARSGSHDRQDHTTVVMGLEASPIPGPQTGWT
jgi:hypothetical protein